MMVRSFVPHLSFFQPRYAVTSKDDFVRTGPTPVVVGVHIAWVERNLNGA